MRACPNCGSDIFPGASDCPRCGVVFAADGTVVGRGRQANIAAARMREGKSTVDGKAERPYVPGKLAWANLSLAIAFTLSFLWSPGSRLVLFLVERPVLQSIPPYKAHILTSLANYWVVALLVYLVLRFAKAEHWLKLRPAINAALAIGNALLVLYLVPRIIASSVEGGGASFLVATFSPFFVLPAGVLFLVAFGWLTLHSLRARRALPPEPQGFTVPEYITLTFALAVPVAYASTLYMGEDAPLRLAREARAVMLERCQLAGERMHLRPAVDVKGLFLQRNGAERFEQIKDGVYQGSGGGLLGDPLVNSGLLLFFETLNDGRRPDDGGQFKYREFGVFYKDLTTESERRLGIRGAELTVMDLRTNDVLATTTYFVSRRDRRFCGHAPDGAFDATQFVMRALDLKKRYPIAPDNPSAGRNR
jgi:hypothetical protein